MRFCKNDTVERNIYPKKNFIIVFHHLYPNVDKQPKHVVSKVYVFISLHKTTAYQITIAKKKKTAYQITYTWELRDAHYWLVSLWLTGEKEYAIFLTLRGSQFCFLSQRLWHCRWFDLPTTRRMLLSIIFKITSDKMSLHPALCLDVAYKSTVGKN